METERPELEQIMVVETEYGHYGFVVDEVLGNHQTVIKNLGRLYRNVQGVTGATILGNGTVALILDPHRLVQMAVQAKPRASPSTAPVAWRNIGGCRAPSSGRTFLRHRKSRDGYSTRQAKRLRHDPSEY